MTDDQPAKAGSRNTSGVGPRPTTGWQGGEQPSQRKKAFSPGDAWKVTVEQWNRTTQPDVYGVVYGGERRDDLVVYAVANTAQEAAEIVDDATTSDNGPLSRVVNVEYAGSAWAMSL